MSATGRSDVRQKDDFYRTPTWVTRAIFEQLAMPRGLRYLDPCCGDGAILDELRVLDPEAALYGYELDAERANAARTSHPAVRTLDGFAQRWCVDVVVMNPPFGDAERWVWAAIEAASTATCAVLLRLAWLEGQKRAALHREHPSDVYVLSKRPSFYPASKDGRRTGSTDSSAYAWFVWGPGRGGRWSVLSGGTA